jgi:hypothetical protein
MTTKALLHLGGILHGLYVKLCLSILMSLIRVVFPVVVPLILVWMIGNSLRDFIIALFRFECLGLDCVVIRKGACRDLPSKGPSPVTIVWITVAAVIPSALPMADEMI